MKSHVRHGTRLPRRVSKQRAARARALHVSAESAAELPAQHSVPTADAGRTPRLLDVSTPATPHPEELAATSHSFTATASTAVKSQQQQNADSLTEIPVGEMDRDTIRCEDGTFPHAEAERLNARVLLSAQDSPPPHFSLEACPDPRRLATRLFDLQLWCLGRDIEFPEGNLLLRYGMEKIPPPAGWKAVSLYRQSLSAGVSVLLRGFGLLVACERQGIIFVPRESFRMVHWPAPLLTRLPWRAEDLPPFPTNRPASSHDSREPGLHLTRRLLHWLADYETWIQHTVGVAYREQSFQAWHKAQQIPLPARILPHAWLVLGDALPHVLSSSGTCT